MAAITVTYPTVKTGCKGEIVTQLQFFLSRSGSGVKIDGIFHIGTRNAVKAFQRKHDLEPDGIVGPKTWTKLLEVCGNIKPSEPVREKEYMIQIPHLTESQMKELLKQYEQAFKV